MMMIAVVILIVIGPQRLPETLHTLGLWMGRLRRSFLSVKAEIEKEVGMDDIRRQLHNEAVMEEMRKIEEEVKSSVEPAISATEPPPLYSDAEAANPSTDEQADTAPLDPEPEPALPRSEAELEAMHEARAKQAAREKKEASSADVSSTPPPAKEADSG